MYFILKGADFSSANLGQITVVEGTVGSGGSGGDSSATYTLTVEPTPSTATVALTASGYTQSGNSITVVSGTKVSYEVSATGYVAKSGSWYVYSDTTKTVTLSAESSGDNSGGSTQTYTYTVNATPSTATVKLTASGYNDVSGTGSASIIVASGTTVNYTVSASGYTTKNGSVTVTSSSSKSITLNSSSSSSGTSTLNDGTFIASTAVKNTTGATYSDSNFYSYTDVPVTAGETLILVGARNVCFFDSSKTFLGWLNATSLSDDGSLCADACLYPYVFTVPAGSAYMSYCAKYADWDSANAVIEYPNSDGTFTVDEVLITNGSDGRIVARVNSSFTADSYANVYYSVLGVPVTEGEIYTCANGRNLSVLDDTGSVVSGGTFNTISSLTIPTGGTVLNVTFKHSEVTKSTAHDTIIKAS